GGREISGCGLHQVFVGSPTAAAIWPLMHCWKAAESGAAPDVCVTHAWHSADESSQLSTGMAWPWSAYAQSQWWASARLAAATASAGRTTPTRGPKASWRSTGTDCAARVAGWSWGWVSAACLVSEAVH